jgi:hypothetical protein
MITNLNQTHKDYLNFLLTNSVPNYFDYRAGASLIFLFPYYIQLGLAQIFSILELNLVDKFQLIQSTDLIHPVRLMQLIYNLLGKELPPATSSLLLPKLNLDKYNILFGYNLSNDIFFQNTITQINSTGLIGNSSLFSIQDELLPRERLEKFFRIVNFNMDNLDKYIDIAVNNNRIEAAAIFCQYFNYPIQLTQQVINEVEVWNLNN